MIHLFIVVISSCVLGGATAQAESLSTVLKNNEGVKAIEAEKGFEASRRFLEALSDDDRNAILHFNLGYSFEKTEELEKAIAEYKAADEFVGDKSADERKVKFATRFNIGRLYGQMKKIDEAIEWYQKALEIEPDSKETKTNIELLLSQNGQGGGGDNDQQQQSGGEGEKDKKNDDKGDQKDQKTPQKYEPNHPQKKPFESKDISKQDVDRMLDELRRQEEQIRGRVHRDKNTERPRDKDW